MALFGKLVEHAGRGRPGAGSGLLGSRQAHLAKQDVAQLLGRTKVEALARKLVNLGFQPRHALRKFARQAREDRAVDGDAALLHARQHRRQSAVERLVDARHAFCDEARLEETPEPQRHVGILGGIFGGALDGHAREADEALAGSRNLAEWDRGMAEMLGGELVHAMPVEAIVEHIGHQHCVVEGADLDAKPLEDVAIEFHIMRDFQDAGIFQQRPQPVDHRRAVELAGQQGGTAEQVARSLATMGERNVAGAPRRGRERHADEIGL